MNICPVEFPNHPIVIVELAETYMGESIYPVKVLITMFFQLLLTKPQQ